MHVTAFTIALLLLAAIVVRSWQSHRFSYLWGAAIGTYSMKGG